MKRFILLTTTLFCLLSISQNIQAQSFSDGTTIVGSADPVWGNDYLIYSKDGSVFTVTDGDKLKAAIIAANNEKPNIILIANSFSVADAITISESKNIVLRKIDGSTQKPWDFNTPWITTDTAVAVTPDLYDGEPDWFITQTGNGKRHFIISADNTSLTLENITLDGDNYFGGDISSVTIAVINLLNRGGIDITGDNCIFRGFIRNCTSKHTGGGITVYSATKTLTFRMLGGVISRCASSGTQDVNGSATCGGAIGETYINDGMPGGSTTRKHDITIKNSIIEQNGAFAYGGGIFMLDGILTLNGTTTVRDNIARFGGGIMLRNAATLNLSDNSRVERNCAFSSESKPSSWGAYPGLGGGIASVDVSTVNLKDNAAIANNRAYRGGGGIMIQNDGDTHINLSGGSITGNVALGIYRELVGADADNDYIRNSIGGGGAIYTYKPTQVKIPAESTTKFSGNSASAAVYIDNTTLQNGTVIGSNFFDGDDYISHIQKSDVQTSLVNSPGPVGQNYYNLYNNYDIGVPNNLPNYIYALISTNTVPANGTGGSINRDALTPIYDILGDGRQWAEVAHPLEYTAVPMAGYIFTGWKIESSGIPTHSEMATLIGLTSAATQTDIDAKLLEPALNLNVKPFDTNITANFKKLANLVITLPDFPVLALDANENIISDVDQAKWPGDSIFTVSNDGDFDAHITGVSLVSGDINKFTLVGGGSTQNIAAGDTNKITWTIRPDRDAIILDPTPTPGSPRNYTVIVRFAYTDDKTGTNKTADVEVSFTVVKTSILFTGNYGFGTVTRGHADIDRQITLHNYGVENSRLDTLFIARNFNPNTYTGSTDLAPFLDNSGVFQVGQNSSWGILADAEFDAVTKDDDNTEWSVRLLPNTTGIYQRQLVAIYSSEDDPSLLFATVTPLTVTLITPAVLTAQDIRFPDNREGYPIPPNTIPVNLVNSGQTATDIKSATLQSGAGSNFNLTSGSNDHVPGVVGQVKGSNNNYGVTPKLGLNAGIYQDTVVFIYEDGTGANITLKVGVEFRVYPPVHTWIGGGGQGSDKSNPDVSDHAWSVPANWKPVGLPASVQYIEFDTDAIDLHVDGIYGAANITNTTSANLRILKDAALKLTDVVNGKTTALDFNGIGKIHVESGGTDGANGALIVPKGSIANASFTFYTYGIGPDNATTTGAFSWQYFGIPVKQYQAILMEGGYIRKYVETNNNNDYWEWLTNSDVLEAASGYEITRKQYQGGYFTISGELNTNDITLNNLTVTASATPNSSFPGQHVVSNPYASGLSIRNALEFGENMYQSAYLFHTGTETDWDNQKAVRGFAAGQYIAVPQQYAGEAYLPDTIASMQGFVVRVFADKPSGDAKNSLTFKYDNLTHGNTQLRAARMTGPKVYTVVSLSETDGELKDRFWLFSDRSTTLGYDNGYDGYKIFGEATLARLYAKPDGRSYQVSAQPTIDNTWLFMKAANDVTDYTLTFHHGNIEERYDNIYLYDAVTKTTTDVTEDGSTYRFTANNVLSNDQRFLLTTTQNTIRATSKCTFLNR